MSHFYTFGLKATTSDLTIKNIIREYNIKCILDVRPNPFDFNQYSLTNNQLQDIFCVNTTKKKNGKKYSKKYIKKNNNESKYVHNKQLSSLDYLKKLKKNQFCDIMNEYQKPLLILGPNSNIARDKIRGTISNKIFITKLNGDKPIIHLKEINDSNKFSQVYHILIPYLLKYELNYKKSNNSNNNNNNNNNNIINDETKQNINIHSTNNEVIEGKTVFIENPNGVEFKDFIENDEAYKKAMNYMDENGYLVIKNVISKNDIKRAKSLLWDFLEGLKSGINRDNITTWNNNNWPQRIYNGLIAFHGIGQSRFLWYLRGHNNIVNMFKRIYNTNKLLTSFTGCGLFRPYKYNYDWKTKDDGWLHIDQNPLRNPNFELYQGFINLVDVNKYCGGFYCIPKSHKHFKDIGKRNENKLKRCKEIFMIPKYDPVFGMERAILGVNAGDFVLWDSRTVHSNISAQLTPKEINNIKRNQFNPNYNWDLIRITGIICMVPISKVPKWKRQDLIIKRKNAVKNMETTSHNPLLYLPTQTNPRSMYRQNGVTLQVSKNPKNWKLNQTQFNLVTGN